MRHNNRKAPSILREAAVIVRRQGLAKGWFFDDDGKVCARAAMNAAAGLAHTVLDMSDPQYMRAYDAACVSAGVSSGRGISTWSDRPETTAEDVALAFERAAKDLEAR